MPTPIDRPNAPPDLTGPEPRGGRLDRHPVIFYEDDGQLCDTVARWVLAPALERGHTVAVVATPEHRVGFAAVLRAIGIDLAAARAAGRYVELDAAELLASAWTDDGPDPAPLATTVAAFDQAARAGGGRLHVFSEMVWLLWQRDLAVAALQLEEIGNDLLAAFDLDLVCAYPTRAFPDGPATPGHVEVCGAHTTRIDATTTGAPSAPGAVSGGGRIPGLVRDQLELAHQMLDTVDAAVVATDLDGTVLAWNEGARRFHGWTAEQAIGRDIVELTLAPDERDAGRRAWSSIVPNGGWEGRLEGRRADGTRVPVHARNRVVYDAADRPVGVIAVADDLTDHVERERALHRRNAWLRSVTDLMNEGLATLGPDGRIVAVNPHGERLLAAPGGSAVGGSFVNRLLPVRADGTVTDLADTLIGAEFDGHLPDETTEARLLHTDGTTVPIEYVATEIPPDEDGQPNGWVVVFHDISDRLERERQLRVDADHARWMARIQQALDRDQFVLHAQPIVGLDTGRVVQHELLIRLLDPQAGLIGPGAFMPTAEAYGLAPAIDRWVVTRAMDLAAAGRPMHVNLSARSFADPNLPRLVRQLLDDTGADPSLLVFELTETAMLHNAEEASRFAEQIRSFGCRLALDDFGTGFGAFVYLKHLPVDLLKIDIEFVRDATTNPASRHVITAVVTLARSLGIHTVAEGVEDQATLDLLVELGVDQAQGYHLGRPAPLAGMAVT